MTAINILTRPTPWLAIILLASLLIAASSHASPASVNDANIAFNLEADKDLLTLLKQSLGNTASFTDRYDEEVWLLSKVHPISRFIKDKQQQLQLLKKIHTEAHRAGLQPEIVLAVIEIESGFNRYAISSAGALGMMQVMPFWKNEIGRIDDNLISTDVNLRYGCTILKYYLDKEEHRLADALARYNGSYGSYRYSEKVLDAWAKHWR